MRARGDPLPIRHEVPLVESLLLCAAVGVVACSRLPGFPIPFALGFAVAAAMRGLLGRSGAALLPARVWQVMSGIVGALALAWLLGRSAHLALGPMVAVLALGSLLQGMLLLGRLDTHRCFGIMLTSSVQASGAAFVMKGSTSLALTVGYAVVLLWTLLLFERQSAFLQQHEAGNKARGVRRLRVSSDPAEPLPMRYVARTLVGVLLAALPLAAVLFVVSPRPAQIRKALALISGEDEKPEEEPRTEADARSRLLAEPSTFERSGMGTEEGGEAQVGPSMGVRGIPWGEISRLKVNQEIWLEIRERKPRRRTADEQEERRVILRGATFDRILPNGDVQSSDALGRDHPGTIHVPDATTGVVTFPSGPTGAANIRSFDIEMRRGDFNRLYMPAEPLQVRVMRADAVLRGVRVREHSGRAFDLLSSDGQKLDFWPGDSLHVVCDERLPLKIGGEGRASDALVSPSPAYLQLDPSLKRELTSLAQEIVGDERDPWTRAILIRDYLRSSRFTYSFELPVVRPQHRIVDFLKEARSGHCEYFALSMCTLLRCLGHPSRYVVGFWKGEPVQDRIIMRAFHAHAWTEMYLDGLGWVPLDATAGIRPESRMREHGVRESPTAEQDRERGPVDDLLEYGRDQQGEFFATMRRWLDRYIGRPLRWLFGPDSWYLGSILLSLALFLFWRGKEDRQIRRSMEASGRRLPRGPYGKALVELAKAGMRKQDGETPREFVARVRSWHRDLAQPFASLTRLHEAEVYGRAPSSKATEEQARDLLGEVTRRTEQVRAEARERRRQQRALRATARR